MEHHQDGLPDPDDLRGTGEAEETPRRRKLDELFADEPFLSPTMKARRLHEKLNTMRIEEQGQQAAQGLPTEAYVQSAPEWPAADDPLPLPSPLPTPPASYTPQMPPAAPLAGPVDAPMDTPPATVHMNGTNGAAPKPFQPVTLMQAATFLRGIGQPAVEGEAAERLTEFRDGDLRDWLRELR